MNSFFDDLALEYSETDEILKGYKKAADALYAQLFAEQKAVIDDPYRFKSLLTPRRCGKSHLALTYALITCLRKPKAEVRLITLTLSSAKSLYWQNIIDFGRVYGLGFERTGGLQTNHGIINFMNGSRLTLAGAENKAQIEKQRGAGNDLVIIDECKSFHGFILEELITDIIKPSLQDRRGTLLLIGTPGNILAGPFFEATYPGFKNEKGKPISRSYSNPSDYWSDRKRMRLPQWSRHSFTQKENIHCPQLWEDSLLEKVTKDWADDNPTWLREYCGKWIATGDEMVYRYANLLTKDKGAHNCRVTFHKDDNGTKFGLPLSKPWRYVMSIDMGFEDDCAIIVAAYSDFDNSMYLVYEFKENHLLPHQVAEKIRQIKGIFGNSIETIIADTGNLGKAIVEEFNSLYGFGIVPAEKRKKYTYIELLNSDMEASRIKVPLDSELASEWLNLTWDLKDLTKKELVRAGRLRESKKTDNHLSDAFLYAWRFCYHNWAKKQEATVHPYTKRYYELLDIAAAKEAQAKRDEAKIDMLFTDDWESALGFDEMELF